MIRTPIRPGIAPSANSKEEGLALTPEEADRLRSSTACTTPAGPDWGSSRRDDEQPGHPRRGQPADLSDWSRAFRSPEEETPLSLTEGVSDADALLMFFAVASPEAAVTVGGLPPFRQTQVLTLAGALWHGSGGRDRRAAGLADFDESRLRSSLDELRRLTGNGSAGLDRAQEICSRAASRSSWSRNAGHWISGCAVAQRHACSSGSDGWYKTDDQLWFTFFPRWPTSRCTARAVPSWSMRACARFDRAEEALRRASVCQRIC